jgi:hypothetical protein
MDKAEELRLLGEFVNQGQALARPIMPVMPPAAPRTFFRGENPGDPRKITTGTPFDRHLFAADNRDAASMYGSRITKYTAAPDAKILREGTKEFVSVAGRWRKGESMLDYASRAADAAKAAGYDALWFKRQSDIGTAIFNPDKFKADK